MVRAIIAVLIVIGVVVASSAVRADVPISRFQDGINFERDQLDKITNDDLDYLHDTGIHIVRVFMWPKFSDRWNYLTPGQPMDPEHNPEVQVIADFVRRCIARDIAVIVVPFGGSVYKPSTDPQDIAMQVGWMEEFAAYADFRWDPDWVYIQTWNEPLLDNPQDWRDIQEKLISAIHRNAPKFTIVATSLVWSSIEGYKSFVPYKDKKVVYDLHYYLPMEFTHQGMPWMGEWLQKFCNVRYPSSDPNSYNAKKIQSDLSYMANWAKRYKVKVVIGEFGAGNNCVDPGDKAAWLHDVRSAAEKYGMGWLIWEYSKAFSIVNEDSAGVMTIKPEIIDSMGWKHADHR